ncbi:SHOCT domain-containing protein [Sporosarcina sp. G11-34]|uniref:SHOCT domain-containing protein n=1 Tax=Sporosarcina sp. G11-34 TaxID=2849605 RepID=UPI0022A9BE9E|nr:SHOCT domain-containing protein [Sporosarcina sp. G11-34]MCZ2258601.1 SHOCT domain-containing protein [Sporosarcina sp. G11-34]
MGCLAGILIIAVLYGFTISVGTGIAFLTILILILVGMLIISNSDEMERAEKLSVTKAKIEEEFKSDNFKPSQQVFSCINVSLLALDEESKQLAIVRTKEHNFIESNEFYIKYYSYKDLLESHILEDGVSTTQTSRTNQIGGALIGGVLAGGVGAIIGGLSSNTKTSEDVKSVILQIVVNNTETPVQEIMLLNLKTEVKKDNVVYKQALSHATHWHKLISVLINHADKEDRVVKKEIEESKEVQFREINSYTTADEIRKLHDLLSEGIITQEEFDNQKKKVIS